MLNNVKKLVKKIIRFVLINFIGKQRIINLLNIQPPPQNPLVAVLDNSYNHTQSVVMGLPVGKNNKPIPWFTYPAIDYLSQFDLTGKSVFEWGSGNSSLYFAERNCIIYSIEDNPEWYEKIKSKLLPNQHLFLKNSGMNEYVHSIADSGLKYDIIIIDGNHYRYECALVACDYLKKGGIIILDNSDWFKNSAKFLRKKNLIQVDFHGLSAINYYMLTTSIFFSRDFNFQPLQDIQPVDPEGGLRHVCD